MAEINHKRWEDRAEMLQKLFIRKQKNSAEIHDTKESSDENINTAIRELLNSNEIPDTHALNRIVWKYKLESYTSDNFHLL